MQKPGWNETPIPELGGRTWLELELIEHPNGGLLFKDEIRKRGADGKLHAIPVRVRVPRPADKVDARARARVWFGEKKLDPERDSDLFDEMEQVCLLALAIRTNREPFPQFADAAELAGYDEGSLQDVLGRMVVYGQLLDPREAEVDDETFFVKLFQVVRVGHLGPLTDIAGSEHPSFLLRMAELACNSPTAQSFARSLGISTQEPSPIPSSHGSSEAQASPNV